MMLAEAGTGTSEQVRKAQLKDGTWVPNSQLTPAQRRQLRADLRESRGARGGGLWRLSGGQTFQQAFQERSRNTPAAQTLASNTAALRHDSGTPAASSHYVDQFRAGLQRRLGNAPAVRNMPTTQGQFRVPINPLTLPQAAVVPTRSGLLTMHNPVYEHMGPREGYLTGIHESAHYATDSQARRGRARSPYRLAQILNDPLKIAREEGRADGTMRRLTDPASRKNMTGYEQGFIFNRAQQAEYNRVRAQMGARNRFGVPRALGGPPHGGVRIGDLKGLGKPAWAAAGTAAALGAGYGAYWRNNRRKRLAKSYTVHERRVDDLEARFERQRNWRKAAKEGATSLALGEYQYLPQSAWGHAKHKAPVRRAYAQRSDPRFFDQVAYAQTSDPKAKLQVRQRSPWAQRKDRARSGAELGAVTGGAGLALGMRKYGANASSMLDHARTGNWRGLLPGRKALRVGAVTGLAGAVIGSSLRPAPVDLRYRSARG